MAYKRTMWKDHVTQYSDRYNEVPNQDGSITHTPVEGQVIQQGTPQNAANFNNIEEGVLAANHLAIEAARMAKVNSRGLDAVKGESIDITMTNSRAYPFNNSQKTISLTQKKTTNDYVVEIELISATGGGVGDFVITDKLLNGFKLAFTGAATSVVAICRVKGGI
ncbi:MAG: hypothetical protein RR365_00720 [Bacteroides sp.]